MIMWAIGMLVTSQGWTHGEEARATLTSKKAIICPRPLPYDVPPTFLKEEIYQIHIQVQDVSQFYHNGLISKKCDLILIF